VRALTHTLRDILRRWELDGILSAASAYDKLAVQHVILPYANALGELWVRGWNAHRMRTMRTSPNEAYAYSIEDRSQFLQRVAVDGEGQVVAPVHGAAEVEGRFVARALATVGGVEGASADGAEAEQVIVEPPTTDIPWWFDALTDFLRNEVPPVVFEAPAFDPASEDGGDGDIDDPEPRLRAAYMKARGVIAAMVDVHAQP